MTLHSGQRSAGLMSLKSYRNEWPVYGLIVPGSLQLATRNAKKTTIKLAPFAY
jgi:hypothetical protein